MPRLTKDTFSATEKTRRPSNPLSLEASSSFTEREENRGFLNRLFGTEETYTTTAALDVKDFFRQRLKGGIDLTAKTANIDTSLGSTSRGLGVNLKSEITLNQDNSVKGAGIEIGVSILGIGGSLAVDSEGRISVGVGISLIGVKIARDRQGNFSLERSVNLGPVTNNFKGGTSPRIYPWNQSKIPNLKSSSPRIYTWGKSKI